MLTVFTQIFILLLFVAAGFALGKVGLVGAGESKVLSTLLVYIFLPCNIIKTFSARFNVGYISENWYPIVLSSAAVVVLAVCAHLVVKLVTKNKYERSVFEYSLVVPNSGYMGYALAEAVFGAAGLMSIMTMALPLQIYIYTYGFAILTKRGMNFKKLINPVIISTLAGMLIGLFELPIPQLAESVFSTASACMAPVSMILVGLVISEFRLRDIVINPKAYVICAIKLLVIPILIGVVFSFICDKSTVAIAVLLYSLPCGMNSVVFPKLVGEDCRGGAGIALISTVCSALTVPLVFLIFGL